MLLKAKTLSISIDCPPLELVRFVSNPRNLPQWAPQFCKSVRRSEDNWIIETTGGPASIHFVNRNDLGVLDHVVTTAAGEDVSVPMRVVANGSGSEVLLTVFQLSGMTDNQLDEDAATVMRDLQTLKQVLEGKGQEAGE